MTLSLPRSDLESLAIGVAATARHPAIAARSDDPDAARERIERDLRQHERGGVPW